MPTTIPTPSPQARVPRYQVAEQGILERIIDGKYTAGQRLAAVNDLANDFGVSPSTMRQSLQSLAAKGILECVPGRGTSVSPDALQLIGQPVGTAIARSYSLIIPDIRFLEFSTLAHSVQAAARDQKFELTVSNTEDHLDRYIEELQRVMANGSRGIMIVPPLNGSLPLNTLVDLKESGIPVVTCYRPIEALGAPWIRQNVFDIHHAAAAHLIATGCSTLGLVHVACTSEINRQIFREGLHGHKDALLRHKQGFNDELVLSLDPPGDDYSHWAECFASGSPSSGDGPQDELVTRVVEWLEAFPQIDGVVCYNDYLAGIVLESLRRCGRRVPDDVSVIARGSVGFQTYTPQPVTLFDVNLGDYGQRACTLLRRLAAGETFPEGYCEFVEASLIERGTTRPINATN